ncbi:MAG: amino acid decarboxylase [Calditrichaeota bacterium]|nr:MAG: amino acid decarboxylase [Calditrichota bacterium]
MKQQTSPLGDMPLEEFQAAMDRIVAWICRYRSEIDRLPVLPEVKPGQLRETLAAEAPEQGEAMEQIWQDFERLILPGITHWNHPRFFAYFSITGSLPGALAELASAVLNVNAMLWKTSPAATELEEVTLAWLRRMLGLPEAFFGLIYDTASISTMHALAAARDANPELAIREKGMAGRAELPRLRIYTSDQAHSSVEKAAITLGFGLEGVSKIPSDERFQMIPAKLAEAVARDRREGWLPLAVVATVGTTSTTSVDPVPAIAEICRQENLWLHVDAAYGGMAAILPEKRHVLEGCQQADSIVVNPHKWLFVPIDLSAFYTRRPEVLRRAFSLVPAYLQTPEDAQVNNLMDYGLQLGRRFRALKLWFVMRYFGRQGLQSRIRQAIALADQLAGWIDRHPNFQRMAPVPFSTVCFRARPPHIEQIEALNRFNRALLEQINRGRRVFLSGTEVKGQFVLRAAIGNILTTEAHLADLWDQIQSAYQQLAG